MALKYHGYALIALTKAVGEGTMGAEPFSYEVTIYDKFGRVRHTELKTQEIDHDWCKLRMTGDKFAQLVGSVCRPITEEEWAELKAGYSPY